MCKQTDLGEAGNEGTRGTRGRATAEAGGQGTEGTRNHGPDRMRPNDQAVEGRTLPGCDSHAWGSSPVRLELLVRL
jgi:hypothetical protein